MCVCMCDAPKTGNMKRAVSLHTFLVYHSPQGLHITVASMTRGRSLESTVTRESSAFQVCFSLHPFRYSNKCLALPAFTHFCRDTYACLPCHSEMYNASSIASEPGLSVTNRAAKRETGDPGCGVTKLATSKYTGDAVGGDCVAIGDTGKYLGLGSTDCATLEYTDDACVCVSCVSTSFWNKETEGYSAPPKDFSCVTVFFYWAMVFHSSHCDCLCLLLFFTLL